MNNNDMMMALNKSFIDKNQLANSNFEASLVKNNIESSETVLEAILTELDTCKSFTIAVAFVSQAGLALLKSTLADLADKGISGRLITSTYLGFNSPQAFRDLLNIPNIEVKISDEEAFHIKGYAFDQGNYSSFILGSSNLTDTALKTNLEWNFRLVADKKSSLFDQYDGAFSDLWESSFPLSQAWIDDYAKTYVKPNFRASKAASLLAAKEIKPNSMQEKALANLDLMRTDGVDKALLVSATGTGKTYLSAFDVAKYKPKKFLFIVHREQILLDAMETFKSTIGGLDTDYGFYTGGKKELDTKYIFATIQSLSKEENYSQLDPEFFDYILIDEVHRAGAKSYQDVINYFKPSFMLGMTATPERTDDFNLFELFDYNIAHEIRLQDAMNEDLLTPFHYYGVTDYEADGQIIDETSSLTNLISSERVDYLLEKISYYGHSGDVARGLVFTSSVDEARAMSDIFNARGLKSTYLSGQNTILERERQIKRLEDGEINYIFTRDIFNEGIDIPSLNQVIMLRNTESSIVFIQQLGRGLRLHDSKDYVVIIDFIGNYKNNYLIPQALTGDNTASKDSLRRDLFKTNFLSGLSSINFEEVAKERIYESINSVKLDSVKFLKDSYTRLNNRLGRIPTLLDFENFAEVDPFILATKFDIYPKLLAKIDPSYKGNFSQNEMILLRFFGRELLKAKSSQELYLLTELLKKPSISKDELFKIYEDKGLKVDDETFSTMIKVLDMTFWVSIYKKVYSVPFISFDPEANVISRSSDFEQALKNPDFLFNLEDLLQVAFSKSKAYDQKQAFTSGKKYEKRDVTRFLNFDHQEVDLAIAGYKIRPDKKNMMIFLTMTKTEEGSYSQIRFENKFIGKNRFTWYSKRKRTLNSPEILALQNYEETDLVAYVFIKKSDAEKESDSYFVGRARPVLETIKECKVNKHDGSLEDVVEVHFELLDDMDIELYKYLTN